MERLSVEDQLAGGQFINAGQHLHQRGLARAVFSDDRVDFACAEREVDVLDCGNAPERPWSPDGTRGLGSWIVRPRAREIDSHNAAGALPTT